MSMREEFEAWIESVNGSKPVKSIGSQGWWYSEPRIEAAWDIWQASRAAVAVKLGKRWSNQDGDWFEDEDGDSLDYRETIQALESAGVQVKP